MLLSEVPKADRAQILTGCIGVHKTYGWVVFGEFDNLLVTFKVIKTGKMVVEECLDENFQLKTPQLGYVNVKGHAVYLSRIPRRIMKGGVCSQNIDTKVAYSKPELFSKDQLGRWAKGFPPESVPMFEGKYPSYDECVAQIKEGKAFHIAFDRQFSICSNGSAYYCGQHKVGTWDEKGINFLPEYAYLDIMIGDNCGKALQSSKSAPKTRIVGG